MKPALLLVVLLSMWFARASSSAAEHPNILFITADDLNHDSVGCYGCPIATGPKSSLPQKRSSSPTT